MMEESIEHGHNASGIGKNLVPFFERPICRENDRLMLIASIDDFVE